MKRSQFKEYIKERVINELSEAEIEIPADDLAIDKGSTIKVTEEVSEYDSIIGPIAKGISKLEAYVRKEGDGVDQFIDLSRAFNRFDEYMAYGNNLDENEDEEPTDKDLKKKDSVAKTATKLKDTTNQMKTLAKKFKEAEGAEKEKIKDQLKKLTKVKKELEAML